MVPRPTHCNIPHAASSITSIHTYYRARIDSDMPYQHPIFYPIRPLHPRYTNIKR